ncbi:ubiquitin domain-containing protein [Xylariaceae sp. FL0016]|nr:ubiquitin domain-containing protein [Xylariaceae sp. FL0016]
MGCCFSRPEGLNAPYPGDGHSPSARAINPPAANASPSQSAANSPRPPPGTRRHRVQSQQPLSQHIDKPLRRHQWTASNRTWTTDDIDTERADFFDTRVTGRPEVWQVLKTALEILWEADRSRANGGEYKDEDGTGGLATAQSILKAAEVTLPTGDLANGVYDSLGNYYAIPEYIVCDPTNVAESSATHSASTALGRRSEEEGTADKDGDTPKEGEPNNTQRRREEKGKAVVDVRKMVKVRARLSENSPDVVVSISPDESVRSLARAISKESGLPSTKRLRIAYMGSFLQENTSLQSQGWNKGYIINAFVFDC